MTKRLRHAGFHWILIPTCYSLFLVFGFWTFAPSGVSQQYLTHLLFVLAVILISAGIATRFIYREDLTGPPDKPRWLDLTLVLIPLNPIIGYVALNKTMLYLGEAFVLLLGFGILFSLLVLALPILLSRWTRLAPLVGVGIGISYSITVMPQLSATFEWQFVGNFGVQLAILAFATIATTLLYRTQRGILYFLSICMLAGPLIPPTIDAVQKEERSTPAVPLHAGNAKHRPNIYLLTYDAYVNNETMLAYGIDNSAQERWLQEAGFAIFPKTYSVSASSINTMGRVFGERHDLRRSTSGDSPLTRQLKSAGYTTYGIFQSDYFFQGVGQNYDVNFPDAGSSGMNLTMAILEGRFRHDAALDKPQQSEFVAEKRRRMQELSATPKFLYAHSGPGHSQNSGECLADETEQYRQRLLQANVEMKADVALLQKHDPDAVIIINGDHGPYLTSDCYQMREVSQKNVTRLDMQDRYGTFLAISGPSNLISSFEPTILQDLAPALLGYIYPGQDFQEYEFLPRSVASVSAGVILDRGIIIGGRADGQPLYLQSEQAK